MIEAKVGPVSVLLPDGCGTRVLDYLAGIDQIMPAAGRDAGSVVVKICDDAAGFEAALQRADSGRGPASVGVAALHPKVPGVRVLQSKADLSVVIDWDQRSVMELVPGSGQLDVWAAPALESLEQLVCFVVGNLLVSAYGVQAFHGSVIRWRDRHVLFAGPSGSGKTSFSLALAAAGARWVTEDVTHSSPGGREFVSVLMRDHISVRPGTYAAFRDVLETHAGLEYRAQQSAVRLFALGKTGEAKVPIPPTLIHEVDEVVQPLAAAIFPVIDPRANGVSVQRLSTQDASMFLDCLLVRPVGHVFALPLADGVGLQREYPRAAWSTDLPAYSVRVGLDYRDQVADLCDELLGD